jgi:hypothetical protein
MGFGDHLVKAIGALPQTLALKQKSQLVDDIERSLNELELHGREVSGERDLASRLRKLLADIESHISAKPSGPPGEWVTKWLNSLMEKFKDVDWEIAEDKRKILDKELEERTANLVKYREMTEEFEKLFTEAYSELEAANKSGVRLATEAKYVGGTLEKLKAVKLAFTSKLYRDVPSLFNISDSAVKLAKEKLGLPLSRKEDLPDFLEKIRERVKTHRPFTAQADLLLLLARTLDTTEYTVLLRTPSRPGTHGVNIQGSSTLVHQDRIELAEKVQAIARAIRDGDIRDLSIESVDEAKGEALGQKSTDLIGDLGRRLYRLVMPEDMQRYLQDNPCSVTITTNDLELPWELMRFKDRYLCLEQPVARMPMGYTFPRQVEQRVMTRDKKRFALIWSDPNDTLPFAKKEIEDIENALRKEAGTELRVYQNVTSAQMNDLLLASQDYDVIHYAGHAHFDREHPERSALLVRRSNKNKGEPERFFAQKIRRLLEGQPLVFLNGCESASTAEEKQSGYVLRSPAEGLASAFVYGGALGCVGSLWPLQDKHAAEFAVELYRPLLDGETLGEAMRNARLIIKKRYPDSATWATLVLYGDPTFRL